MLRAPSSTTRMICSGFPSVVPLRRLETSRRLMHRLRHIGRAVKERGALPLDQRGRPSGVKRFLQNDASAVREQVEEGVDAAESPEQRDRQPKAILARYPLALADTPGVLDQTPM